ncbi:hypothetical protein [Sedimenticola sp.]|uniref:hypothetical protein n=1 Tax=Sedimenticola sp. TaxID=1940285 RepID=UPI003D0D2E34
MKQSSRTAMPREGMQPSATSASLRIGYHSRKSDLLIRAIIWGFVGSIFGGLYIGFIGMLIPSIAGNWVIIPAAAFAGAVGAAFYGSFQVAIIGTLAGAASGIGYLIVAENGQLSEMSAVSLVAGVVAGFIYGNTHREVSGALMKALTGLVAGALAGSLLWLSLWVGAVLNSFFSALILVPITGAFYVSGTYRLTDRLACRLPLPMVGSLVAALLSVVIAGSIWSVHEAMLASYQLAASTTEPAALIRTLGSILGGAIGGMVAGGLFARVGLKWQDAGRYRLDSGDDLVERVSEVP